MTRKLSVLAALLLSTAAHGQATVKQSGNVTPGHAAMWTTTGVISDGGTSANGKLTSIGVTATGPGICQNSAPITSPFYQLCLGVTANGGGSISLNGFGGATNASLTFNVNGNNYSFPYTIGGILGPNSSVVGHVAAWNNTTGSLLQDPTSLILPDGSIWNTTNLQISPPATVTGLYQGILFKNTTQPTVVNGVSTVSELDHFRVSQADGSPNQYTITGTTMGGVGAEVVGYSFQMESTSGSDSGSNMYGVIGQVTNAGPGTTKAIYGRATSAPGSTGTIEGLVSGIQTASTTGSSYGIQISGDTYTNSGAVAHSAALWFTPNDGTSVVKANYGILLASTVQIQAGGAGFHMAAGGAGDFLNLVNGALTTTLFQVDSTGGTGVGVARGTFGFSENLSVSGFAVIGTVGAPQVGIGNTGGGNAVIGAVSNNTLELRANNTSVATLTPGGVASFLTSAIAPTVTGGTAANGINITTSIQRNNSAGSLAIGAGTGAGNNINLLTAGSTRLGISDAGIAFVGTLTENGSPGITQTCTVNQAKTLVFANGILVGGSCNS